MALYNVSGTITVTVEALMLEAEDEEHAYDVFCELIPEVSFRKSAPWDTCRAIVNINDEYDNFECSEFEDEKFYDPLPRSI